MINRQKILSQFGENLLGKVSMKFLKLVPLNIIQYIQGRCQGETVPIKFRGPESQGGTEGPGKEMGGGLGEMKGEKTTTT